MSDSYRTDGPGDPSVAPTNTPADSDAAVLPTESVASGTGAYSDTDVPSGATGGYGSTDATGGYGSTDATGGFGSAGGYGDTGGTGGSGKVDAAKQEASNLKDTATDQAKDVLGTAKSEAKSVASEAKSQAKDLYAQTTHQLKDQANTQQQRIAGGLRSVGDELDSMARNSENSGVASDLVGQVSSRLSSAGNWLADRDPASVLDEVKRFARRRPGAFILGAAITGIVAGRLTRALASTARDEKTSGTPSGTSSGRAIGAGSTEDVWTPNGTGTTAATEPSFDETPIYAESSAAFGDTTPLEDGDGRRNTL